MQLLSFLPISVEFFLVKLAFLIDVNESAVDCKGRAYLANTGYSSMVLEEVKVLTPSLLSRPSYFYFMEY